MVSSKELIEYPYFSQVEKCTGLRIGNSLGKGQFGIVFSTNDDKLVIKLTLDKYEALIAGRVVQIRSKVGRKGLGPSHILPGIVFLFGIYTIPLFKGQEVYAIVREAVEPIDKYRLFDYKDLYPNINKISDALDHVTTEASVYHRENNYNIYALENYCTTLEWLSKYANNLSETFIELVDNQIIMKDTHIGNIGISTINWGKYRKPGELVLFDLGFTPTNNDYELMVCQ